jgi:ABC-type multidrug transport system fused ATPase/permease subunit
MQNRTTIVIAHRLSTIRRANVIYAVKDGEIVEHGTHDELIKTGGVYACLHELQFSREESSESLSPR